MQRPAVTHWGKTTETHWLNTSLINSGFQLPSSCLFICSAVALVASHIRGSSILPSLGQDHCLGLRTSDSGLDVVKYPGARHRTITESLTDRLSPAARHVSAGSKRPVALMEIGLHLWPGVTMTAVPYFRPNV